MSFLAKFFPLGKTNALRGKISSFQQIGMESIPEAWERLQEYIIACPHHGMDGIVLCPLRRMVLVSSPSSFFALFGRWMMVFLSNSFEMNFILLGKF
jgi:hypothetical protein